MLRNLPVPTDSWTTPPNSWGYFETQLMHSESPETDIARREPLFASGLLKRVQQENTARTLDATGQTLAVEMYRNFSKEYRSTVKGWDVEVVFEETRPFLRLFGSSRRRVAVDVNFAF